MTIRYAVRAARLVSLGLLFFGPVALAHTQNGSLSSSASATDLYQITCSADASGTPRSLAVRILDASPGALPLVSVQVHRNQGLQNATDTIAADATPSAQIAVNEGVGAYDVLVDKSGGGLKYYTLTYHCASELDGGGFEIESTVLFRQDQ